MYDFVLGLEGFDVIQARDGAEALARLDTTMPDVVVTDVSIPGIDGIELLARLRANPRTAEVPVIVMSGWAGADVGERALAAGAKAFLLKPFPPEALIAEIHAATATPPQPAGHGVREA